MNISFPHSKRHRILAALIEGPLDNKALCSIADDIPAGIGRTMAELGKMGLVENVAARRGRGTVAIYALTDAGLARAHAA